MGGRTANLVRHVPGQSVTNDLALHWTNGWKDWIEQNLFRTSERHRGMDGVAWGKRGHDFGHDNGNNENESVDHFHGWMVTI